MTQDEPAASGVCGHSSALGAGLYRLEPSSRQAVFSVVIGDRLPGPKDDDCCGVLDAPGYRQAQGHTCGFTAGLLVLHALKPRASLDRFWRRFEHHEDGTDEGELTKALEASGIGVESREDLNLAEIRDLIGEGFPIIVGVTTRNGPHWAVLYGLCAAPSTVYLAGVGIPHLRSGKVLAWSDFTRRWKPQGNGLVCWGV